MIEYVTACDRVHKLMIKACMNQDNLTGYNALHQALGIVDLMHDIMWEDRNAYLVDIVNLSQIRVQILSLENKWFGDWRITFNGSDK